MSCASQFFVSRLGLGLELTVAQICSAPLLRIVPWTPTITNLSSLCPVLPNSSSHVSKAVLFQVITSLSLFTIHWIPFTLTLIVLYPPCCNWGLSLYFAGILLLQGGNSTVVALYWECPAAGMKTVTIVRYPKASESAVVQLPHLLIVASLPPAGVKTIAVGRYQEAKWRESAVTAELTHLLLILPASILCLFSNLRPCLFFTLPIQQASK